MAVQATEGPRFPLAAAEALIPAAAADLGNPDWNDAAQRVLILRLSPIEDVAASSSHLFLFAECRGALPSSFIDFAFLPGRGDRAPLEERGLSFFYGLASGRAPEEFDLILVSNAFALELVNLGYLFSPRLPSRASARAEAGDCPIIALGGSNASAAGCLLLPGSEDEAASDCLVDGIFFGEGEASVPERPDRRGAAAELAAILAGDPSERRASRLKRATRVPGFWAALSGNRVARAIARPAPVPLVRYPVLNSPEAGVARLQISAGCHGLCSFCLEGWDRRPYREVPVAELVAAARELRAASGAETLEIHSFNFNTHSSILELVFELGRIFKRVNLMSQRLDILARHPGLVAAELAADKRSFTLGVEGISRRMRAFYRKGLSDEDLEAAASALVVPGVRELKLFYILAGSEGGEDLAEMESFVGRLSSMRRERGLGIRIVASAGFLARLPSTPLQYAPLCLDRTRLSGLADSVRSICGAAGIEFRLAVDYDEYLADQLLSLGGRSLGPWIERAASEGMLYDGGLSRGAARSLEAFAEEAGTLGPEFLAGKPEGWEPPLAFASGDSAVLRSHYLEAAAARDREGCLGLEAGAPGRCSGCGACEDPADPGRLTSHAIADLDDPGGRMAARIGRLVEAKRRLHAVLVLVDLPESLARATPEYRASWITRLVAARAPAEARALLEVRDALHGETIDRYWGRAIYGLHGPDADLVAAAARKSGLEIVESSEPPRRIEAEARLPVELEGPARSALEAWLKAERLDYVETRIESGRRLECPPGSARKRIIFRAEIRRSADSTAIRFSLGPKARLREWLRRMPSGAERATSLRMLSP